MAGKTFLKNGKLSNWRSFRYNSWYICIRMNGRESKARIPQRNKKMAAEWACNRCQVVCTSENQADYRKFRGWNKGNKRSKGKT